MNYFFYKFDLNLPYGKSTFKIHYMDTLKLILERLVAHYGFDTLELIKMFSNEI
jgi:hypothetical protein